MLVRDCLVGAAIAAVIGVGIVVSARAHDGYEWIMNEPRYVDRVGIHCCSRDCTRAPASDFYETQDGIIYKGNEKLLHEDRGIYRSEDPKETGAQWWWVCRRHDKLRCIFRPRGDS